MSAIFLSFTTSYTASPFSVGTSSFFSLQMYSRAKRVSIIAARVAGVPMPDSFMASRSASSSTSRAAISIAPKRDLSVCMGRGLVCFSNTPHPFTGRLSSSAISGSMVASSYFSSSWPSFPCGKQEKRLPLTTKDIFYRRVVKQ